MDNEVYFGSEMCGTGAVVGLHVFIIVKALVLVYISLQGIYWFCKSSYNGRFVVVSILLISIALVIAEAVYRFAEKDLRFRFTLNALSQWQVFVCLTIMVGFTRRNDAASLKLPVRCFFILVHLAYFTSFVCGVSYTSFW